MSPPRLRCLKPGFTRRLSRIQIQHFARSAIRMSAHKFELALELRRHPQIVGSRNAIIGAVAIATARLRAAAGPLLAICTMRILVWSMRDNSPTLHRRAVIDHDHSNAGCVCASTDAIASRPSRAD